MSKIILCFSKLKKKKDKLIVLFLTILIKMEAWGSFQDAPFLCCLDCWLNPGTDHDQDVFQVWSWRSPSFAPLSTANSTTYLTASEHINNVDLSEIICTASSHMFYVFCFPVCIVVSYDIREETCRHGAGPSVHSGEWGRVQEPHWSEDESDRAAVPCEPLWRAECRAAAEVDGLHSLPVW